MPPTFPVDTVLNPLLEALCEHGGAILEAPTGAGKSTRVPLRLLESQWARQGRILMLEPRRVAARSVATYMAEQLGESAGKTVGYRTRTEKKISSATVIEVVTEGVLTRMLLSDPELTGISLVIFDEFHERSLQGDLGLALISECRDVFRPDLGLLVMSATLDCGPLTDHLKLPLIKSEGRSFPVAVSYAPVGARASWEDHIVSQIRGIDAKAIVTLVFLPGQASIRRVSRLLGDNHYADEVLVLHGGLSLDNQQQVLARAAEGNALIILATNVAETSLTIEHVTHVIDSGWVREPVYDAGRHRSRLETRRVSEASAKQRAGRAGRLGPGSCIRCWSCDEVMAKQGTPEIRRVGLDQLVLDLARWGCLDPSQMRWLDLPPDSAWKSAVARLMSMNALDRTGAITPKGEVIASLGLEPSLAMLVLDGKAMELAGTAARIAALLSDRDILSGQGVDLRYRLQALEQRPSAYRQVLDEASRIVKGAGSHIEDWQDRVDVLVANAMPMQLGRLREGQTLRYQMADGPGVILPEHDPLAGEPWLLIMDTDGQPRDARVRLALPVREETITAVLQNLSVVHEHVFWDAELNRVVGRLQTCLGEIVLHSRPMSQLGSQQIETALLEGIRQQGLELLPWTPALRQWLARVRKLSMLDSGWPSVTDEALLDALDHWLLPYLAGMRTLDDLKSLPLGDALASMLDHEQQQRLAALMPESVAIPTGRRVTLDYGGEHVVLAVKLQELFGMQALPELADGRLRITAHLLTPAGRPAAITDNLSRFWRENYEAVRKELRGRYPKHPWPDDPLNAQATAWTKKRAGQ